MRDQESVRTWEKQMPTTPDHTIPMNGGYEVLAHSQPANLKNPIPLSAESVERGRLAYTYFCIQCHGPNLNGLGTVGQSFYPLPADLTSPDVLQQSDGELYYKIRVGFKRHPSLFITIPDADTWSVVNYMRTQKAGGPLQ
jgi:mono/diheme cytochrome c family protein